ncbi:MAG: glycogen/starch/alpha-glucan phosphorylase [Spirochaetales bacterium]|nr:glycogen/starch/alpha-glucan phosphorylase [Spirochaetales bacterium]
MPEPPAASKRRKPTAGLPGRRLTPSTNALLGVDVEALKESFVHNLEFALAKDEYSATALDNYKSLALTVRDRLFERWIETQQAYYRVDAKRVYYLSLEFLIGRTLGNAVLNLGLEENLRKAMEELGYDMEDLEQREFDAGLGNGGLGRLAACFLDSMATLALPAYGYGIRYEYGIFYQRIRAGAQVETPDSWLRYGNPWEIERPEFLYPVRFYGQVNQWIDGEGRLRMDWTDTQEIMAMAYDTPVPGYRNDTVNNMRLWAAKSTREFDLDYFNHGDYEKAVSDKAHSETISKVLYPNDNVFEGRELRLKQEYFFVSATLQDILRRYRKTHPEGLDRFGEAVAIQLNDTHPAVGIPELMRLLVDEEGMPWKEAWQITVATFAYTNHTILPEALEKWPISLFGYVLPRHLQIVYEINRRFLEELERLYPGDGERKARMSIIEEGPEKKVRMAQLAIVGSHSVNGVSALHSRLLREEIFREFYELWPERFNNKTNGITPRRWLRLCNPPLAALITGRLGEGWVTDLQELHGLTALADDPEFQARWREAKRANKLRLAECIRRSCGIEVDPQSLFDCQVKRIHEYKRQLLNLLHVISLYLRIRDGGEVLPRTVIFAGKAAPGYAMAKLVIRLIHGVAEAVNNDPAAAGHLKVVFLPNYGVSLAEIIIPAAELSEQISTAGTEASGTGNMKFALNGALTIGTLDGANVEMREEVGEENIFVFGLSAEEVARRRAGGYDPRRLLESQPELRRILEMIGSESFSSGQPGLFAPILRSLLEGGDPYMLVADFEAYRGCQERVAQTYRNPELWTRMSILNVAGMGRFSSDRTVAEYAREVWGVEPVPVELSGLPAGS